MATPDAIRTLFEPSSVAVIGASRHPQKIGYKLVENILASGYQGRLYPVNPSGGSVLDVPVYRSLAAIEDTIDLVCVAIPAKFTVDAVKQCADRGVQHVAIITSGFSEIGHLAEEREMVAYARARGTRILGPNIFGIYSSAASLNATFGPKDIQPGHVALITQSGALGIAMMGKTRSEGIGMSAVVSVGNKSDIDEADLLEYLADDPRTRVVLMYIEGVKHGPRLVRILQSVTQAKPVVVIKSGRSRRGAMAAASHTGSLAGADEIFSDVMAQCGVLRAETIDEALNWCKFLSTATTPAGENSVIVTNGGGIGVLAADACEKYGVRLYDDIETLEHTFHDAVPEFGSVKNPVDITGQGTVEDYERALSAATKNPDIHSIICLGCETAVLEPGALSHVLAEAYTSNRGRKPIVYSFLGGSAIQQVVTELRARNVPIYGDVYEAVASLGALYAHERHRNRSRDPGAPVEIDAEAIGRATDRVRADGRRFLLVTEGQAVMTAAGVPIPRTTVARGLDETVRAAEEIGYPVVLKVVSKEIVHKSDVGGVALDLETRDEVIDAYEAILHRCRRAVPRAVIEGVEVSQMVRAGTETIIGARQDPAFGPIVMFGLGGIYVEVMKDVAFRALPMTRRDALTMIKEIRSYPLLLGVRGEAKKDIEAVADAIMKLGAILEACPDISDIEVNPLVVYDEGAGVQAVDVRVILSDAGSSQHE